jgi:hypothetical protein
MPAFKETYGSSLCAVVLPTFSIGLHRGGPRRPTRPPRSLSESMTTYPELRAATSCKIALSPHAGIVDADGRFFVALLPKPRIPNP